MAEPNDKTLYNRVKAEAKKKFDSFPSAYASMWIVREYKKRGGTYSGAKKDGTTRWVDEKWLNVGEYLKGKKVPCGDRAGGKKAYCRPSVRISKDTPKTIKELSRSELERRVDAKKKKPDKRVGSKTD